MRPAFKLFNIPIVIGIDFFILVFFLAIQRITVPAAFISWIAVVFVSILVHELGHAFVFKSFGFSPMIRFYSFGGLTCVKAGATVKPWQELVVSLAGPLSGLALGGICYLIFPFFPRSEITQIVFGDIFWVNIGWSLLNLLPLYPLDGGHVANVIIRKIFKKRGEIVFYCFSMAVAAACAVFGLFYQQYWIAILAAFLFGNNLLAFRNLLSTGKDKELEPEMNGLYSLVKQGKYEAAVTAADGLAGKAVTPTVKNRAVTLGCWALYKMGENEEALKRLESMTGSKVPDKFLYGILLHENGRFDEAKDHLLQAFVSRLDNDSASYLVENLIKLEDYATLYNTIRMYPGAKLDRALYQSISSALHDKGHYREAAEISELQYTKFRGSAAAYNSACSKSRMNDKKAAFRWLRIAVEEGWVDRNKMENDPDLAGLKEDERFTEIIRLLQ
ncbi:MAG: hypothetical protein JW969_08020 [Spirochaetales bacterium]|nr:hypothetical protein [Spirochaetales bacterium]